MSTRARIAWAWVWVGLCIAAIWTMSGEGFSGAQTSGVVGPFLRWLLPDLTAREIWQIHVWVRKTAHVVEYGVLAVLSFRALYLSLALPLPRIVGLALLIVVSVAGADELRQSYLPARTGASGDVFIDFTGGVIGVIVVVAIHRFFGIGAPSPKEGA